MALAPYHEWLKTNPGGSLDDYFTQVQGLTPYDKGTRLEPKLWINPASRDSSRTPEDYGKVDFDNEESATVFTVYAERDDEGYVLKVDDLSGNPIRVELSPFPGTTAPYAITPTPELQAKVAEVIAELRTEYERGECVVFWEWKQALILVPGERHNRKQQAIMVHEGSPTSSAIVKNWADGIRDTRID